MSSTTWQDWFSLLLVIKFHNTGISPDRTRQKRRNYAKTAYLITICYTINIGCRFCRNCGLMPKQNSLQMFVNNKIKRGKIAFCQALPIKFAVRIFPLGRKEVKFCGKRQSAIFYYLPQNEGKTTAERGGFAPKSVGAKCRRNGYFAIVKFYPAAFSFGA